MFGLLMRTWSNLAGIKCPFDAHRKKGNNKAGCNMSEETCCLGFLSMKEFYHKKNGRKHHHKRSKVFWESIKVRDASTQSPNGFVIQQHGILITGCLKHRCNFCSVNLIQRNFVQLRICRDILKDCFGLIFGVVSFKQGKKFSNVNIPWWHQKRYFIRSIQMKQIFLLLLPKKSMNLKRLLYIVVYNFVFSSTSFSKLNSKQWILINIVKNYSQRFWLHRNITLKQLRRVWQKAIIYKTQASKKSGIKLWTSH